MVVSALVAEGKTPCSVLPVQSQISRCQLFVHRQGRAPAQPPQITSPNSSGDVALGALLENFPINSASARGKTAQRLRALTKHTGRGKCTKEGWMFPAAGRDPRDPGRHSVTLDTITKQTPANSWLRVLVQQCTVLMEAVQLQAEGALDAAVASRRTLTSACLTFLSTASSPELRHLR